MIPRKRLQALLYILQIFYVFGDGDPGNEGLLFDEQVDNIIDDTTLDAQIPDILSSFTHENGTTYIQSKNVSDIVKLNEVGFNSHNVIVDDLVSDKYEGITNLTIDLTIDAQDVSVNVSWIISEESTSTTYLVYLCFNGSVENSIKTTNLKDTHTFTNLEPCSEYTIGIRLFSSLNHNRCIHDNAEVRNFTTSFSNPGPVSDLNISAEKVDSLHITWEPPLKARNCVKQYKIIVDNNENEENRHSPDPEITTKTSYTFNKLYACNNYSVTVIPLDENGKTYETTSKSKKTLSKPHTAPVVDFSNSTSPNATKNSVTLTWRIKDKNNNCSLDSVTMFCKYNSSEGSGFKFLNGSSSVNITDQLNSKDVTITVKKLSPFTNYLCKAQSFIENENKSSDWSIPVPVQTSEDVSEPPQNFEQLRENSKLSFTWKLPNYLPGKLLNYKIVFTWIPQYPVPDRCETKREFIVDNIDPLLTVYELPDEEALSHYTAKIYAKTGAGWSSEAKIEFDSTLAGVPDQVTNLTCIIKRQDHDSKTLDTILEWSLPCSSRGFLSHFNVSVSGTRPNHENHTISTQTINVTDNYDKNKVYNISFGELRPLYNYKFEVFAVLHGCLDGGEIADLDVSYPPGMPPHPETDYIKSITLDPHKARRTTSSAAILLPLFPDENGEIIYYAVIVSGMPFDKYVSSERFDIEKEHWPNISSWEEAMERDFNIPFQATEPNWNPFPKYVVNYGHMKAVKFVIGEDTTCPEVSSHTKARAYCNGPLKADTWYEVRMRAFTQMGYTDSVSFTIKTNAELNVGLVLGVVFGILFIGILTTLMLLVKRCSFRLLMQRIAQSNIPESPVPNPLTRRKFINHCQQLAENPGKMSNEFQLLHTLSEDLQMPSNAACLQANRKKNRYSDILPYDFSRVKLQIIDNDPNSDYINASFIRGYTGHEEYIACQGPKEETTYDFWRMIEQYDVKMILMLTQLVERGKEKCYQYFPTIRETFNYENISIRCTSELDYRNFTQRTLVLQKEDKKRTITHLYFKEWPDHDVPDDFDAMIHFCQIFRKQFSAVKGLAVVHCSAGIGRTGTLIAIDILLQSIRDNRKLDVFGTVYRLRKNRLNMVQRESQYAYIYNCIRQVLKNPYFLKTYKPPPIDPLYPKIKVKNKRSDSSTDLVDSVDTPRKNSLSTSIDSMQPLCQSSPQTTPKIKMNGLRYCKSTGAIDVKSNHNRIGRYNSEGYAICESVRDSFSTTSNESVNDDLKSSTSSLYENIEPLIQPSSSQSITNSNDLINDNFEKDTSL